MAFGDGFKNPLGKWADEKGFGNWNFNLAWDVDNKLDDDRDKARGIFGFGQGKLGLQPTGTQALGNRFDSIWNRYLAEQYDRQANDPTAQAEDLLPWMGRQDFAAELRSLSPEQKGYASPWMGQRFLRPFG